MLHLELLISILETAFLKQLRGFVKKYKVNNCCPIDLLLNSGPKQMLWVLTLRVCNRKITFLFSTKTYVMGTQKNRLNETVCLSTQNMLKIMGKKIFTILR